ncbi:hypothetical protein RRF57_007272 [Xylaria bambusicola]|uniref:3'-5' exonuclease domain-containing protein n=1 Tax=Xylaria bambusicola TaxID=326684 RepID=A0AAN7UKV7_9PEZI
MSDHNIRPATFNRDQPQWPMIFALSAPPRDTSLVGGWHHYYYRGSQHQSSQVLYGRTRLDSETIARRFMNEPVLGFDMEWPWDAEKRPRPQDKVALIQLASERKIGLFHIALHEGETTDDLIASILGEIIESKRLESTLEP